ncbi:hypothetical protein VKA52_02680 [Halobacillus sp. HZG1]|nr:hypothetical protein [Halobacillus sp. HZG1]MEC3882630.1 hypothetical protein [Halobacillus sp. HZG1]
MDDTTTKKLEAWAKIMQKHYKEIDGEWGLKDLNEGLELHTLEGGD